MVIIIILAHAICKSAVKYEWNNSRTIEVYFDINATTSAIILNI